MKFISHNRHHPSAYHDARTAFVFFANIFIFLVIGIPLTGCHRSGDTATTVTYTSEDFGVSVSQPDENGYITVVGYETARPRSIISARVIRPRGFQESDNDSTETGTDENLLIRSLAAGTHSDTPGKVSYVRRGDIEMISVCDVEYPVCPRVSVNNQCFAQTKSDGSFALQVPGQEGEVVNIKYINPFSCRETPLIDGALLNDNIIGMNMMAYDMSVDSSNDRIYVVGDDNNRGESVRIFEISSQELIGSTSFEDIENPKHVSAFTTDASDGVMMFIAGDDLAKLGVLSNPDVIDTDSFYDLTDASGNILLDMTFGSANDYRENSSPSCNSLGATQYSRILMHNTSEIYFHEYDGAISNAGNGIVNLSSASIKLNQLSFSIVDSSNNAYSILDIPFAQVIDDPINLEDSLYLVAEVATSASESKYLFLKKDTDRIDFCGENTFEESDTFDIGSDSTGVQISIFNGMGLYSNSAIFLGILKKASQEIVLIDTEAMESRAGYTINYLGHTATDGDISYNLNVYRPISSIAGFARLDDELEELLVFSSNLGGSDFIVSGNYTSAFEQDTPQFAFTPRNDFYFPSESPFIVLDSGISDENNITNYSFIRFYDLTPSQ